MRKRMIVLLAALALLVSAGGVRAQDGDAWGDAVNLSRSGAASAPVIVSAPDGRLQAFWWDAFEGLTTAVFAGGAWSSPAAAPILMSEAAEEEAVQIPLAEMPQIVADGSGVVHAWWLGEADRETGLRSLLHSRLAVGATAWSAPEGVAESALAWHMSYGTDGTLHLVYVRPLHSDAFPAGVYHRRSTDGGATWEGADVLYGTIYFRTLATEDAHVWAGAGGDGQVYAAWDDPRLDQAFVAASTDGGATWGAPQAVGEAEQGGRRAWVAVAADGTASLFWEASRVAAACALYQQQSTDGGATWGEPRRALDDLRACPTAPEFRPLGERGLLLTTGSGSGGLTLAAWDGGEWSETKSPGFSFEDEALGRRVYLDGLRMTLVGDALAVVGLGQDGEAWALQSQMSALDWAFAAPSPWSEPVQVSEAESWPGLPAVATDAEGQVHLLWSVASGEGMPGTALVYARWDGSRWTTPAEVVQAVQGGQADDPSLVVRGEQLHVVWSGDTMGRTMFSRAYVCDAYAAGGWSDPVALPSIEMAGSEPVIVADLVGVLHVVYAVPLNEGRGIHYTRSGDGGETWSEAAVVFDAEAAGWAMADRPALAVDESGVIHVAWVRAPLPGGGLPEGVYYARSLDRGATWSEEMVMVEGAADWPRLAATLAGQVHLLWEDVSGAPGWQQRWSTDGGATWTRQERVRGLDGVPGPVGLAPSGTGTLHVVGVGQDEAREPALRHLTWLGEQWGALETARLAPGFEGQAGAAMSLRPELGRLDVAFRGVTDEAGTEVWTAARELEPAETVPEAAFGPHPTTTPTAGPSPTPLPTPRPTVNAAPPQASPPMLELGPISLPLVALGGIALAALLVVGVMVIRSTGRR